MALGYLPVALVRQNFDLLTNRRRTRRLVIRYPALQDFFNYVRNNYFNGLFPPPIWNVYDRDCDNRTNNAVERRWYTSFREALR